MRRHTLTNNEDKLVDLYIKYYTSQSGGRLPVFRGQSGDGLGDILRGIMKHVVPFVMPILSSGLSSFVSGTSQGLGEGKSLKESVRGAVRPSLASAAEKVGEQIRQGGGGLKRRRVYKLRKRSRSRKAKSPRFQINTLPTNF